MLGEWARCTVTLPTWARVPECSSPPKPYLKQQASGTRWRTWGETLTFALFESTFGKEQVQLVLLEEAVVAFPLRNELQQPADPGSHAPGFSFPLNPPVQHRPFLHVSFPPLPFVAFVCECQLCTQPGVITLNLMILRRKLLSNVKRFIQINIYILKRSYLSLPSVVLECPVVPNWVLSPL